jgi:hypothetical protein
MRRPGWGAGPALIFSSTSILADGLKLVGQIFSAFILFGMLRLWVWEGFGGLDRFGGSAQFPARYIKYNYYM